MAIDVQQSNTTINKEKSMKKFIILFLFFGSFWFTEAQIQFSSPLSGEVKQSNSYEGCANITYWFNSLDIVRMSTSSATLQIYNAGQWLNVDYCAFYASSLVAILAGNYRIKGVESGWNYLGQWVPNETGYVYFSVQDNVAPATPTNFSISVFYTDDNGYPQIRWDQNGERDVRQNTQDGYIVERKLNNDSFSQLTTVSGTTISFIDYGINYASLSSGNKTASYRIKAKDVNGNLSIYTDIKTILYGYAWKLKPKGETNISEYRLHQNYPNPFNPNTRVQYEVKEPGLVKLEVYDILGNKIYDLVNEVKGIGSYSIVFNAGNLPSGTYLCKLSTNNFISTKKMILLK